MEWTALFSLLALSLAASLAVVTADRKDIGCFVDGACHGGIVLEYLTDGMEDEVKCSEACDDFTGCNYFTYHHLSDVCFLYDECPTIEQDCFDCISGRAGCSCFKRGKCHGHEIETHYALDEFACWDNCRGNADCAWMTYLISDRLCTLLEDCPDFDGGDENFVSAPKDCSGAPSEDPLRFMAIGGYVAYNLRASTKSDDVEIVDLENAGTTCMKPPELPLNVSQHAGAFVDGKVIICGGFPAGTTTDTDECYEYANGDEAWSLASYWLTVERGNQESLMLSNGTWMQLGGYESGSQSSTDIFIDGAFQSGPDLIMGFNFPRGIMVNSTHFFLTGDGTGYTSRGFLVDVEAWDWTELPEMDVSRSIASMGMVENATIGNWELVVAGGAGESTTEIFNFESMYWRPGPDLPLPLDASEVVQLSQTFLVVGGRIDIDDDDSVDAVYEFDRNTYEWVARDQRMKLPRDWFAAVPLPDDWDVCS